MKYSKTDCYSSSMMKREFGFTHEMIKSFLPDPDYWDLEDKKFVPKGKKKRWKKETVIGIIDNNTYLKKYVAQYKEKVRAEEEKVNNLKMMMSSFSFESYICKGKMINRHYFIHVGETNSGKTYDSIERLKKCRSGAYLAPLRLMALEVFEKLNTDGYPCSLLTGEEDEAIEGALFISSTIEMCDYEKEYELAVIDEAQLIADPYRGANWTKAICLLKAKEIHICCAPEGEGIICRILKEMDQEYETIEHKRLSSLFFGGMMKSLDEVEAGDCIIAFSRKNVLNIAAHLENNGIRCSVIYGALPPNSRREEIRRFSEGDTKVVVATDAIGMGISLPIRRVIFSVTSKYDGIITRKLRHEEIKQIAGRAGRFGIYDEGYVLTMENEALVRKALNSENTAINNLYIPFPEETLNSGYKLKELLQMWSSLPKNSVWDREKVSDALFLLGMLESSVVNDIDNNQLIFKLVKCPVDIKNESLIFYWEKCASAILSGKEIPKPWFTTNTLEGCELQYKAYDIFHRMVSLCGRYDNSQEMKEKIHKRIKEFLKEKGSYIRRCSICNKPLPLNSEYGICNKCYKKRKLYYW